MARDGTVTSGAYKNSTVTINDRGELIIPAGFKKRRLNGEEVRAWEVVESGRSTLSSHLGQGASRLGSGAANAAEGRASGVMNFAYAPIETTLDAALSAGLPSRPSLPSRRSLGRQQLVVVRVDWADGKQSWIKLPETHFAQLKAQLSDRLIAAPAPAAPPPPESPAAVAPPPAVAPLQPPPPSFHHTPSGPPPPSPPPPPMTQNPPTSPPAAPTPQPQTPAQPDVIEQIGKLAVLRDQGILTEDEFAAKKAELLARL